VVPHVPDLRGQLRPRLRHTFIISHWQSGLHSLSAGCTAAWDPDEGIAEGNAQHPERAHWSGRRKPNTITFLHGKIPAGY
jgi:hypothetical protein